MVLKIKESIEYTKYRFDWENIPKKHIITRVPTHLDVELTNRCDLSCDFCPYHSKDALFKREPRDMDFELYKQIIDEGSKKGLKAVKLSFGGEPLLYPKLADAIKYAKINGILDVQINTNLIEDPCGHLYENIVNSGLDLLIVSDYNVPIQLKRVEKLQKVKKNMNRKNPRIRVQCLMEQKSKWKDLADEFSEAIFYDYNRLKMCLTKSDFECSQPWQRFLILAEGFVFSCSCGTLFESKIVGNANLQTIEELWCSNYMNSLRNCHQHHLTETIEACAYCPARVRYIKEKEVK